MNKRMKNSLKRKGLLPTICHLLPFLCLLACGRPDHFVLQGYIPGAPDSMGVELVGPQGRPALAEGYVLNGKFELKGKTDIPVWCNLRMNNQDVYTRNEIKDEKQLKYVEAHFFVENGRLTFRTPHIDSLPESFWRYDIRKENNFTLKGSQAQEVYIRYQKETLALEAEAKELKRRYEAEYQIKDYQSLQKIQERLEKYAIEFIASQRNLAVNLFLAQGLEKSPFTYDQPYLDRLAGLFTDYRDSCRELATFRASLKKASAFVQGTPLQEGEIILPQGDTVSLFSTLGTDKCTLIDFWASWCGPCRASFPHMRKLYEQYGSSVAFVSISVDKKTEDWLKALDEEKLPWPQYCSTPAFMKAIGELYDIKSVPTILLIDPAGKIIFSGHDSGDVESELSKRQPLFYPNR